MEKEQVAAALDEVGTLLELQGENAFKCNAYHNAARTIEQLETNLSDAVQSGQLGQLRGIGERMQEHVLELHRTGKLTQLEELRKKTPAGLFQMLRIQGLGPKKVKALHDELGIDTLEKLKEACEDDKVAKLKGFGAKTQQKILEGIEFLSQVGERVRIDQALPLANSLLEGLRSLPGVIRIELCGSLRRRRETIADIDILISSNDPQPIMDHFVKMPIVVQVIGQGDTKASVTVSNGHLGGSKKVLMNADLRVVSDEQFPFALHYFTGSKAHNIAVRQRAQARGLKLNEYGLTGPDRDVKCRDEAALFKALDLDYIPPDLREDTGEIAAAEKHALPELIEVGDVQGVFHCHTTYSDGGNTLEEMAAAAKALGLKYFGFGDHSQSLTVANGMSVERVRQQQEAIDQLNKKLKGIKLFKGVECDILADGSLDYPDDVLASFDYVVASVHSHFAQPRDEMTARIVRAIRHPAVRILGHATGRLLLRRDGYQVDLEAVLQAAAQTGTMIEINAHPMRLDIDWVHCKRARALGVPLVINPDAHSTDDINLYPYGVDVARRGWLTKADVFNTHSAAEVAKVFAQPKKG
ncbi:MAG TPA: DNA polymerase/3'-5' exonuclease PolX [Gemmataceae bacterium]|nr:DNA polymerase/3'-5' exonuclease PolX [Gemmataceae bacterium]